MSIFVQWSSHAGSVFAAWKFIRQEPPIIQLVLFSTNSYSVQCSWVRHRKWSWLFTHGHLLVFTLITKSSLFIGVHLMFNHTLWALYCHELNNGIHTKENFASFWHILHERNATFHRNRKFSSRCAVFKLNSAFLEAHQLPLFIGCIVPGCSWSLLYPLTKIHCVYCSIAYPRHLSRK